MCYPKVITSNFITQNFIGKYLIISFISFVGITEQDLLRNSSLRSAIQERKIYVCRANVNGNRIPGALIEKSPGKSTCVVSLVMKVYHQDKFEVLQNVDRAARLLWKDWEKNTHVPHSTVISDEQPIAHSTSPNFKVLDENLALGTSFLMGKIDMNLGLFGKMSVVTEVSKFSSILMPIKVAERQIGSKVKIIFGLPHPPQ